MRTPRIRSATIGITLLASLSFACGGDKSVEPPVATTLQASSSTSLTAVVGMSVSEKPSVIVKDQRGNPMAGVSVTFAVGAGGGSVIGGSQTTSTTGTATVGDWTLGTAATTNTLTASAGSLPVVTFSAVAAAGPAASIAKSAGDNQSAPTGFPVPIAPAVIVRDAYGNPVSGTIVLFSAATGGGSVTGPSAVSGTNGVATGGGWTLGACLVANSLSASMCNGRETSLISNSNNPSGRTEQREDSE